MKFSHYQQLVRMMFEPDGEGGTTVHYDGTDVRQMHPLVLAYIGDAVFTLFVRTRLLDYEQSHVQALNAFGAQIVSAVWQSRAYRGIESMLTEEEKAVFRRARNTKSHAPRSASVAEYHASTGFEAVLGWLFLQKKEERLHDVQESAFSWIARQMMTEIQNGKGIARD